MHNKKKSSSNRNGSKNESHLQIIRDRHLFDLVPNVLFCLFGVFSVFYGIKLQVIYVILRSDKKNRKRDK